MKKIEEFLKIVEKKKFRFRKKKFRLRNRYRYQWFRPILSADTEFRSDTNLKSFSYGPVYTGNTALLKSHLDFHKVLSPKTWMDY